MFVIIYLVVIAYFVIAAISPVVTTVPDTWVEWERIAILVTLGSLAYWWGGVVAEANIREQLDRIMRRATSTEE